jgi:hypothetical protein
MNDTIDKNNKYPYFFLDDKNQIGNMCVYKIQGIKLCITVEICTDITSILTI